MKTSPTRFGPFWSGLLTLAILLLPAIASAQVTDLSEYTFTSGSGTAYDMSGATTLLGNNVDDGLSAATNIGFTFTLGGTDYTEFKANTNGYMTVGTAANSSGCCGNIITSLPGNDRPAIVPFSEDLHNGSDGGVSYKLFGTSPARVLVVNWQTRQYPGSGQATHTTMQARLYEGSNTIELWYGESTLGSGNQGGIGVIINGSNYASVNTGVVSYTSAQRSDFPDENTLYTFAPCQANVAFTGNVNDYGTAAMKEGDSLLVGFEVMRGSAGDALPFSIYNGNKVLTACETRDYRYQIAGPHGADYTITPGSGSLVNGETATPTISFRPGGLGLREATLTVSDDAGMRREFKLHGTGITRIRWAGDVNDGGTANADNGDILIDRIQVEFGSSRDFRPLIISDINTDKNETPPAKIYYTLNDPIGNYSITPDSASILGGEQSVPVITFDADGIVGVQEATLTVTADGETRVYTLRAYNAAPGGRLVATEGGELSRNNPLFVNRRGCVGEEVLSLEITAENTGAGDFIIRGVDLYQSDSKITQGTPPYDLIRDAKGDFVKTDEYFFTKGPGVAPKSSNAPFDSLVVPEGQSRTFYINMVASRPGKRYAMAIIRTNAFNLGDEDINGVPTRGTLRSPLYARGLGSVLATAEGNNDRPAPIVFSQVEVRESATGTTTVWNNGECDLRISKSKFELSSGDFAEFEIVSAFGNTPLNGDDWVLAPGMSDDIEVRFTPENYGSRRASIRLATNDSTLGDGLNVEYGTYYLDVYGVGKIGLEAIGARLNPAVIDAESSFGAVRLENTSALNLQVTSITIEGPTGEFIEDAARPWPALPFTMGPAQKAALWVELKPDGTVGVGDRASEMVMTLSNGDILRIPLSGYVGSRTIGVLQSDLFTGAVVPVGEVKRAYLALTNNGSLPVRMNDPVLVSTNPGDYIMRPLARRVLEPGQTEFIEVLYTPQAAGASSGTITFNGNNTNGDQVVTLGGEGASAWRLDDPSGSSASRGIGTEAPTSGAAPAVVGHLALSNAVPSPARGTATINYTLTENGEATLTLHNAAGQQVSRLDATQMSGGNGSVNVDLTDLPSGTYHIMLRQGGEVAVSRLVVTK